MDSIDFYELLNKELEDIEETENEIIPEKHNDNGKHTEKRTECLITYEPLEEYYITLECGHTFNYMPIIKEVYNQKYKFNSYETTHLGKYQLKCPYCRNIQSSLLPQSRMADNMIGVNSPAKYCMKLYSCTFKNKKGVECDKNCFGKYCVHHDSQMKKLNSMNTCCRVLSSGKRKGEICGVLTEEIYCKRHLNSQANTKNKKVAPIKEKCVAILKSGKRKGEKCGCTAAEISPVQLCKRHLTKGNA